MEGGECLRVEFWYYVLVLVTRKAHWSCESVSAVVSVAVVQCYTTLLGGVSHCQHNGAGADHGSGGCGHLLLPHVSPPHPASPQHQSDHVRSIIELECRCSLLTWFRHDYVARQSPAPKLARVRQVSDSWFSSDQEPVYLIENWTKY